MALAADRVRAPAKGQRRTSGVKPPAHTAGAAKQAAKAASARTGKGRPAAVSTTGGRRAASVKASGRRTRARRAAAAREPKIQAYEIRNWPESVVRNVPSAWSEAPPAPPPPQNCRVCETWLLASAYEQIGIRYRRGGANPKTGFDCSGLMRYLFERNFQISLPPTAPQQFQTGLRVEKWELEPGDLVFFRTRRGWHVGLYVGNDFFLHAPNRRKTVRVSPLFADPYWRRAFVGARRIPLPDPAGTLPSGDLASNNN